MPENPLVKWPSARPKLNEALFLIETQASRSFTFDEVLSEVQKNCDLRSEHIHDHLRSLLNTSKNLGVAESQEQSVYFPGSLLFQGARFLVKPTPQEVEYGVLIAGHRFFPWVSSHVSFQEFSVSIDGDPIEKIYYETDLGSLQEYFSLLPIEDTVTALLPSITDNDEPIFSTLAFDFSDYFDKVNFQEGDLIELTVLNYFKGDLSARMIKGKNLLPMKKQLNDNNRLILQKLNAALMNEDMLQTPVKSLINAHAGILLDTGNLPSPHDDWGELLLTVGNVDLIYFQHRPFLISTEESQTEILDKLHYQLQVRDGRCETLDDLFVDYHIDLEDRVLEAYLRDAMKENDFSREVFLQKIVVKFSLDALLDEKPDIFLDLFDDLIDKVEKTSSWISDNEQQNELRIEFLIKLERINDIAEGLFQQDRAELIEEVLPDLEALRQGLVQVLEMLSHPVAEHELKLIEDQKKELEIMLTSISKQMMYQLPDKS